LKPCPQIPQNLTKFGDGVFGDMIKSKGIC
jgi:hypothetical protein